MSQDREEKFIKKLSRFCWGIGDDCAFVNNMALSKDLLVEDVHFRRKYFTPEELGWKSITATISDLYSCGATPFYFLVGLALPKWVNESFLEKLYFGISSVLTLSGGKITGGDIVSSPRLMISITGIGLCNHPVRRKAGSLLGKWAIYLSGPLGDASAGFRILENPFLQEKISERSARYLKGRFKKPVPRKFHFEALKKLVNKNYDPIAIDLSDDLARTLNILAIQNKARIVVEEIFVSPHLREFSEITNSEPEEMFLFGGEDYEILLALPEEARPEEIRIFKKIGYMEPARQPEVVFRGKKLKESKAWKHF